MTEQDIVDFFKECKSVGLLPADELFPFELGRISFQYPSSYNLDWVTMSLFFQDNFSKTNNFIEIAENKNGKLDLRFMAMAEEKLIDIIINDLEYHKDKFTFFVYKLKGKDGESVNMFFHCLKDQDAMAETQTIDPSQKANEPIHITFLKVMPFGTLSGESTTAS